jgi:hypothetical protein
MDAVDEHLDPKSVNLSVSRVMPLKPFVMREHTISSTLINVKQ